MIIEWSVGFYRPYLRTVEGNLTLRGIFGHVDIWGWTADGTWLFLDPQSLGSRVHVCHAYDDVQAQLKARYDLCDLILRIPADDPKFLIPIFPPLTCASMCGHLLGIRALLPSTLRRKLLAKGAEVVHGQETKGRRSARQGGAAA